jgi:hypothetical protein
MKTTVLLISSLLVIALSGCSSVTPANRLEASRRKQLRKIQHTQRAQTAKSIKEKNRALKRPMPMGPQVISMSVEGTGTSSGDGGQN